ncbi:MAG: DHH family phosphoesterase, partial [Bdellovibrionales bacterium]
MKIISAGKPFIDIDSYASSVAYAELLQLQGEYAVFVNTSELNASITEEIKNWHPKPKQSFEAKDSASFILLDVSDPEQFADFIIIEQITNIIDHHSGFESYWGAHPRINTQILSVGAVATVIFEKWQDAGMLDKMSDETAKILMYAILDNTLNFKAKITCQRDLVAYKHLEDKTKVDKNFISDYFLICQSAFESDLNNALINDTKKLIFRSYDPVNKIKVGQLTAWNSVELLSKHKDQLMNFGTSDEN